LAGGQVPQAQRGIARGGEGARAIRREGDAGHRVGVPRQPREYLAAFQVPDDQRAVPRAGHDRAAIRRELDGRHGVGVAFQPA